MPTLIVLVLGYLLSQFYRSFLAVIAPELARDIGLDASGLGLISAAFFAAFALTQMPVGVAFDRIGPRRTVASLMLAAVLGAVLLSRASSPRDAFVAMILIGVGSAPIYIGALFIIARTSAPARFATLSSVIVGIGTLGNLAAATPLAAGAAAIGWRGTILIIAGLTLAAAAAVFVVVKDPPPAAASLHRGSGWRGIGEVLGLRSLWLIIPLCLTSYPILVAVRGLWVGPYFAEVHGLAPVARGNAVTAMVVAMIVGSFAYAPLDRLFGTRKWVAALGTLATAAALAGLALNPLVDVGGATLLFAAVGGFGMTYGVIMSHIRAFLPDHLVGRGLTVMNMFMIGGTALIQPLSGYWVTTLKAAGVANSQVYAGLFGLLALLLAVSLVPYLFARDARIVR